MRGGDPGGGGEAEEADAESLARARAHARELTSPNASMPEQKSLVDRWIALARQNERLPGQIDELLRDLGPRPDPDRSPTELALWVGSLINPLPGPAMEIRPVLLSWRARPKNGCWWL